MNTRWRKIAGDFREHRLEIFLLATVLTFGVAGVVGALNARAILVREIAKSYERANSPDIILWFDKVEAALLEQVRARPGVAAVDARRSAFSRTSADGDDWFTARISVVPEIERQQLTLLHQHPAASQRDGVFIEQSGQSVLGKN